MNTFSLTNKSLDGRIAALALAARAEPLAEPWFDEPPPSSRVRPSTPPVSVGEFLGDPVADAWLR